MSPIAYRYFDKFGEYTYCDAPNPYRTCEPVYSAEQVRETVRKCVAICKEVADDARAIADSKFVTEAGRQLHEGMQGGASSCGSLILMRFADQSLQPTT